MAVPEYVIEQIRNSNDIVTIISERIILRKTGANYKAVCPFHKEKTPSFVVSPEKQIFHCFGCGEGGNVFSFIMKYDNITFFESLKSLADRAGIELPEDRVAGGPGKGERDQLFQINMEVAGFYAEILKESTAAQAARKYISERGISREVIEQFMVGYAPNNPGNVLKNFKDKYSKELLKKAGLVSYYDNSGWSDKFRNRIMFPIMNNEGKVIAFGGRAMDDRPPKYLNSPDTPLFNKSRVLYGLNLSKKAMRQKGMLLVEGYMDVITAHQYGFDNAVATLGTALTGEHSGIIPRYAENITIVYDGDTAGINAALKGVDALLDTSLNTTVTVLPGGSDPDSFLRSKGAKEFAREVENGLDPVEFKIKNSMENADIGTTSGKVAVASQVLLMISRMKNEIMRDEGIKKLSEAIKVPKSILMQELEKTGRKSAMKSNIEQDERQSSAEDKLEKMLVHMLLRYPDLVHIAFDGGEKLSCEEFSNNLMAEIMKVIYRVYRDGAVPEPKVVMDGILNENSIGEAGIAEATKLISSLTVERFEYRFPEKTMRKLMADKKKILSRKEYNEAKKRVPDSLDRGRTEDLMKYIEKYKGLKGTNN